MEQRGKKRNLVPSLTRTTSDSDVSKESKRSKFDINDPATGTITSTLEFMEKYTISRLVKAKGDAFSALSNLQLSVKNLKNQNISLQTRVSDLERELRIVRTEADTPSEVLDAMKNSDETNNSDEIARLRANNLRVNNELESLRNNYSRQLMSLNDSLDQIKASFVALANGFTSMHQLSLSFKEKEDLMKNFLLTCSMFAHTHKFNP